MAEISQNDHSNIVQKSKSGIQKIFGGIRNIGKPKLSEEERLRTEIVLRKLDDDLAKRDERYQQRKIEDEAKIRAAEDVFKKLDADREAQRQQRLGALRNEL